MSCNSLHVSLDIGTWQCMLAREHDSHSGRFLDPFVPYEERQRQERLIENDRCTFDLYFRPNYDFRQLIATDIDAKWQRYVEEVCIPVSAGHGLVQRRAGIVWPVRSSVTGLATGRVAGCVERRR